MEKGAGVKLVDVGVALSTVQVVQVQPYGYGGQTQPHKVDEQLRIIGILQQFAQFRADAEVRMQKMEAQFKQMRTIIQQQKAIETQQQKQAALEPTLKLVAFRSLQIQNQINQQQQTINQQQKWMDKHEEEQQQPGLWHAEAESDGAYCDESAIDIDRLIASMEQDGD